MGNRHSTAPSASSAGAPKRAASEDGEQTATESAATLKALSREELVEFSSGVCRVRQADKHVGSGFLWRDGWLVTLASVLPSTSDVERATFTFSSAKSANVNGDCAGQSYVYVVIQ